MTAEYKAPDGLRAGYFCYRCGNTTNMIGSGHGPEKCTSNPDLVKKLVELNK